jgi:hypothetical protein
MPQAPVGSDASGIGRKAKPLESALAKSIGAAASSCDARGLAVEAQAPASKSADVAANMRMVMSLLP